MKKAIAESDFFENFMNELNAEQLEIESRPIKTYSFEQYEIKKCKECPCYVPDWTGGVCKLNSELIFEVQGLGGMGNGAHERHKDCPLTIVGEVK